MKTFLNVLFASIWPYRFIRWGLGLLFVYAAVTKLSDLQGFAEIIGAFGLIPEVLLHPAAVSIPVVEILTGVGLLLDIRGSLTALVGLLLLFSGVLGYGIWLGLEVDCGCFGPDDPLTEWLGLRGALYRDLVLIAFCGYLYAWRGAHSIAPVSFAEFFLTKLFSRGER